MLISKTMFKEYSRCPRVSALDNLYQQKTNSKISFFNDERAETISSLLSQMFNDDGDDLIFNIDEKTEALLEYYDNVEKYAMEFTSRKFNIPIHYAKETSKQKKFSYKDENGYEFYCYVDGYYEDDDEIYIFEVKATTAKKIFELGTRKKGARKKDTNIESYNSIFEFDENKILRLKQKLDHQGLTIKQYETNYNKLFDHYTEYGKYIYDIAIERYIIDNAIKTSNCNKKVNYYLVVLNHQYIFDGTSDKNGPVYKADKNNEELFVIIDMNQITYEYQKDIHKIKNKLIQYIEKLDGSPYPIGVYCERKKQSSCPFVNICWENVLQKGSILEYTYSYHGFQDEEENKYNLFDLINNGYTTIGSIPSSWLHRKENQIQRKCYEENRPFIDYRKINMGLGLIEYPVYHLDFETFASPLPRFFGETPYTQSVFQFSVHVEKAPGECDLIKDNHYYLSKNHEDNREELIKKLIGIIDLSNGGTVLVYNKSFEYNRILELSEIFPKYQEQLLLINKHMFDLLDLIKSSNEIYHKKFGLPKEESKVFNYYHPDQQGSFSIKKVLPVFSDLSYEGLNVKNGNDAFIAYATYHSMQEEDLEDLYEDLIKYCRLDTWAMVVILDGLRRLVS